MNQPRSPPENRFAIANMINLKEKIVSDLDDHTTGCAVCNPTRQRTSKEIIEARRKEISPFLHVVHMGDGYHVVQIPGENDEPLTAWHGPFQNLGAGRLFRNGLIQALAEGRPWRIGGGDEILAYYDLAGRFLEIIEAHKGNVFELASELARMQPWVPVTERDRIDDEIPF